MLDKIRQLFAAEEDSETQSMTHLHMAACALLLEVAWADHSIADAELQQIRQRMQTLFDLPEDTILELIQQSRQAHDDSVGLFAYTRLLNDHLDAAQKTEVVRSMWSVAFAEGGLDRFEEATIRRVADLLYVPHANFIATKLETRDD